MALELFNWLHFMFVYRLGVDTHTYQFLRQNPLGLKTEFLRLTHNCSDQAKLSLEHNKKYYNA